MSHKSVNGRLRLNNPKCSVERGNELKHFVRLAKILNGDSWVGSMLQEFHDIVPLVAQGSVLNKRDSAGKISLVKFETLGQGYADNFDLESLLKLQRNYASHFMRSAHGRSSNGR